LNNFPVSAKRSARRFREIIATGTLPQLQRSLAGMQPELAELASKPALDPRANPGVDFLLAALRDGHKSALRPSHEQSTQISEMIQSAKIDAKRGRA
jgi:hypothetical protein